MGWLLGQTADHDWTWIYKDQLVVLLCDYGSLRRGLAIIEEHQLLERIYWLDRWVTEEDLDANRELTPARLVDLIRWSSDGVNRFREGRIELELHTGYKLRYVLSISASNIAAPRICLVLLHLLASVDGVSAKNDGLVDQSVLGLALFSHVGSELAKLLIVSKAQVLLILHAHVNYVLVVHGLVLVYFPVQGGVVLDSDLCDAATHSIQILV